jgi:tripartite-type tricarboxylate transporter receptor subunit TctC
VRAGAALLALIFATPLSAADNYPSNRPIRLVSPFAAGGSTDTVGRLIAPRLSERLHQNVIIENRPGAGGLIGTSFVAKATPDGHTLLFVSGAFTAHSAVTKNLPYDPVHDFAWVTMVLTYPFVVVVRYDSPIQTVNDLIAAAKKNPRKLNYGSVGTGSVFHLAAELFGSMTGTEMTHVPFKGGAEPNTELIAGRLDVIFTTTTTAYPQVEAKRMRALAVTSPQAIAAIPRRSDACADRARLRSDVVQRHWLTACHAPRDRRAPEP